MRAIKAVLVEPVGCLAEFPSEEFNEIAGGVFQSWAPSGESGSEAYWQLLDLMEQTGVELDASNAAIAEEFELQAIDRVQLYEDVAPALAALKAMDITLLIASSLSATAVNRFLEEVPALQPLKLVAGLELRGRGDGFLGGRHRGDYLLRLCDAPRVYPRPLHERVREQGPEPLGDVLVDDQEVLVKQLSGGRNHLVGLDPRRRHRPTRRAEPLRQLDQRPQRRLGRAEPLTPPRLDGQLHRPLLEIQHHQVAGIQFGLHREPRQQRSATPVHRQPAQSIE